MTNIKELLSAFEEAKIRPLPLDEHLFLSAVIDIENRISVLLDKTKEVSEPYELN